MRRFRRYRGLLYSISAAYAVSWKCEVEEPMSLALVLFCDSCWRWDGRTPFKKYLAYRVRWGLNDEGRVRSARAKKMKAHSLDSLQERSAIDSTFKWRDAEVEKRSTFDVREFIDSLSPDAREAVRLALGTGGSSTRGYKGGTGGRTRGVQGGRMSRERLTDILTRRGWTRQRARSAFKEVQEALT